MRKTSRFQEAGFSISAYLWARATVDISLFELVDELSAARYELEAASARLSQAERRLARQPTAEAKEPLPPWYEAAALAENAAYTLIKRVCGQIADMPARTKAGLAVKLRLLADMFADDEGAASKITDRADIGARLMKSIMFDVGARAFDRQSGDVDKY